MKEAATFKISNKHLKMLEIIYKEDNFRSEFPRVDEYLES